MSDQLREDLIRKGREAEDTRIGIFTAHPRGFGFVRVEGEADYYIPEIFTMDAFTYDKVLIEVSQKGFLPGMKPEGRIVKVLERGCRTLSGTYLHKGHRAYVVPDDPMIKWKVFIKKGKSGKACHRDKVVVRINSYGKGQVSLRGEVIEVFGNVDDPASDLSTVLHMYDMKKEFPPEVRAEAKAMPQQVGKADLVGRRDLRDKLTVTIDGEDTKDIDDAVTLESCGDGYLLGVHIADVSWYVKEDSALDREALARGTSVYLIDQVLPMLPEELSNGICSLNEGQDRLTLSCLMRLDSQGNLLDHEIVEGVIRVDRRMTYTGVQAILDARPGKGQIDSQFAAGQVQNDDQPAAGEDHITSPSASGQDQIAFPPTAGEASQGEASIRSLCYLMEDLAAILKKKRKVRGAIDFDFPETKVIINEAGLVEEIKPYDRNTATCIIEDFMLLANETVASDYYWQDIPFVYRVHDRPEQEKLKRLNFFIRNFGYYLRTERDYLHPKEIQKLLFSLEGKPEEAMISLMVLRSMQRARYTTVNLGHFGLSASSYTHFTSPIRRYPDLQIHRIIRETLQGRLDQERIHHYEEILPGVTASSSRLERRAMDAERSYDKLKKIEYMQDHLYQPYEGVISGMSNAGLFVTLNNTVEGLVPLDKMYDDYYIFNREDYTLVGSNFGREYTLGQRVCVSATLADKVTKTIYFILEDEEDGKK